MSVRTEYSGGTQTQPKTEDQKQNQQRGSDRAEQAGQVHRKSGAQEESRRFRPDSSGISRPDKTLCDGAQVFKRKLALKLLRKGVLKGLISDQERNEFPQQIWAVSDGGVPLEAQLENERLGTYHGYPLQPLHPLSKEIVSRWNAGNPTE
jgi:hypothetical protein